jgi:hypothetical protein
VRSKGTSRRFDQVAARDRLSGCTRAPVRMATDATRTDADRLRRNVRPRLGVIAAPIEHGRFGAVSLGHLGRVRLDLMLASPAPHYQPHTRRSGGAEGSSVDPGSHLRPADIPPHWGAETPMVLSERAKFGASL